MRKFATSLIVYLLVLGMFQVFAPQTQAQGNVPFWVAGNYWNYSGEFITGTTTVNTTMKMSVSGTTTVTVNNTDYTTWEVLMWMNMTMTNPPNPTMYVNGTGKSWFRTSDLATVKENMSMTNPSPPPSLLMSESTYDPPREDFRFPLTDSDMWTSTSEVNETSNTAPPSTTTKSWYYNVTGPHSITISGLGTFSTFNVSQQESGSTEVMQGWYSDTVGNFIRMLMFSSGQQIILDLHDYDFTPNQSPSTPTMTITPSTIYRGTTVTFNADSTDPEGDTLSYAWEFGDSGTANTQQATHSYTSLGTFTVNVTVSDGKGGTASNSTTVTVINRAPGQVSLNFDPPSPEVGTNVTMTATVTDADGDTLTITWRFGDGGTGTGANVNHVYDSAGDFTVNVTVTDGHGGYSWKEQTLTVKEKPAEDNMMLYIIIIIVIILIIVIIAVLMARGRKKAEVPPPGEEEIPPP